MNNAVQHTILYERKSGKITHLEKKTAQMDESSFAHIVESHVIGLYPEYTFQTVDGFGCAMTETSCYLLSRMPAKERREALHLRQDRQDRRKQNLFAFLWIAVIILFQNIRRLKIQ